MSLQSSHPEVPRPPALLLNCPIKPILRISQWLPSDLDRREHAFSIALRDPLAPLVLVEDIKNVVSFLEKTYFVAV